jgi:hypothetical protein
MMLRGPARTSGIRKFGSPLRGETGGVALTIDANSRLENLEMPAAASSAPESRLSFRAWLRRAPELTHLCFPKMTQAGCS